MPRLTRAESRLQTRSKLWETAWQLMAERGYHGTTIEQIAEDAEFTRGAFYANFSSKADLLLTYLEAGGQLPDGAAPTMAELWLECSRSAELWGRLVGLQRASDLFMAAVAALHPPLIPMAVAQ